MRRTMTAAIAMLLALTIAGVPVGAQQPDPKMIAEIQEMLDRHDRALNEKNLDALMATFSPAPNVVVMGTGPGERWVGQAEIRAAYSEIFKDFDAGTVQVTTTWKTGSIDGNVAWLAAQCHCVQFLKNAKRDYSLNVSALLVKRGSGWQFQMLHMSNTTGPD